MNIANKPVLCVDLDGTLIATDLLLESCLILLKKNPFYLLLLPFWLMGGKASLKKEIANRVDVNVALLPYRREFLAWLIAERNSGTSLWLCTATNERLAQQVADHLAIFSGVLGSSAQRNLSGSVKADALVAKFGDRQYLYCGNEAADLPVWQHAQGAIVVGASASLSMRAGKLCQVIQEFPSQGGFGKALLKALRPHQWAKNVLTFLPLLAAHRLGDADALIAVVRAFVIFSLCASSVYVINDMLDLEADRQHPRKKRRPFASGDLPLTMGLVLVPLLMAAAIGLAIGLPFLFLAVLAMYFLLTLAYSLRLKTMVLVDALSLAALYTIRVLAGAAVVRVPLSFWMLAFSVFLFLSLALVKRYAELGVIRDQNRLRAAGRGYHVEDLPVLLCLGTSSGYISVLVLALYINSPAVEALYRYPQIMWLVCALVLYWISRIWMIAHRGGMHDDPVMFALKDGMSIVVGLLSAAAIVVAA